MNLTTHIDIPRAAFQIAHTDRVLLVGSCFADEVGAKFVEGGFDALPNPFGTLYNPASIAALLDGALGGQRRNDSLFFHDDASGLWHSWLHHTRFSASSREELAARADAAGMCAAEALRTANVLIVTLGTSIVYRLKENGLLVANCHKQPDAMFVRQRMSVQDIVQLWQPLLNRLCALNPALRVVFTVSPIRHKRDGMHVNQVSKGILLQAVDELTGDATRWQSAGSALSSEPSPTQSRCSYFPAYELMLDELRDYRFYADDMIHPSALAVEYIWQRFQDTYFSTATRDAVAKAVKAGKRSRHVSLTPAGGAGL